MGKKIAVVVRSRQEEALRMAIGLTLMDDTVDVYLLNRLLVSSERIDLNLETLAEMEMRLFSNVEGNRGAEYVSTPGLARRLLDYDHVLPY